MRVFLDANVLFSAAYRERNGLLRLWERPEWVLVTSAYVRDEADRNVADAAARQRLDRLLNATIDVPGWHEVALPHNLELHEKDRPVLQGAIAAQCYALVTGDLRDFGHLMGREISGVLILTPAEFLRLHATD